MRRFVFAGMTALGWALFSVLTQPRWLENPGFRSRIAIVPVVVVRRDIPAGVAIDRMDVAVAPWPVGTQPPGAYESVDSVTGRVSRIPLFRGEAVVPTRLAPPGARPGLEVKITPGKRAYGIRINHATSFAGMLQPNSRVDVMLVADDPQNPGKRVAKLFMSNMRVLALGAAPDQTPDGRPITATVASIEVTPDEAEKLAIAAAHGQLQLVLRGYGDPDSVNTSGATADDVLADVRHSRGNPVLRVMPPLRSGAPRPRP